MTPDEGLGMMHVITGPGKGKTTAAFGLAMRAAGHGYRVCVIQFMKAGETTGELLTSAKLDDFEVLQFGTGGFVEAGKHTDEDVNAAKAALDAARERMAGGRYQLVVLDEVNVAVSLRLLPQAEVLEVVRSRPPGVEVVLTGRGAPADFIAYADYVSYLEDIKNPFAMGGVARKGIEW